MQIVGHQKSFRGNNGILVVIHDDGEVARELLESALLSPLSHFGFPFSVCSIADHPLCGSSEFSLSNYSALVFPQSKTLQFLTEADQRHLKQGVEDGLGLICYEESLDSLPGWIASLFSHGSSLFQGTPFTRIVTRNNHHFITKRRFMDEEVCSDQPLACIGGISSEEPPFIVNEYQESLMGCAQLKGGRVVLFPFSIALYTMEYLGHACGADDLFTRSIIWATRKPFVYYPMPEMANLIVDDCSGSYNHFGYVDTMHTHGWSPYLSLFTETIDEVAHDDIQKTQKKLHHWSNEGSIEIGFHALRYNESFCFEHLQRRPLKEAELKERFARWDRHVQEWKIVHSPWAHPHFGEIGSAAIPYYLDRGISFLTYLLPFDAAWFDVPDRIAPIPPQRPFGHPGYYMNRHVDYPSLFLCNCVLDQKQRTTADYIPQTDYLWNHTPFWDEAPSVKIEEAAQTLALQIRRGIDAGFYGEGATHEQRIACLRTAEYDEMLGLVDEYIAPYKVQKPLLSTIMEYYRKRSGSSLVYCQHEADSHVIHYEFASDQAVGTELHLYEDSDEDSQPIRITVTSKIGSYKELSQVVW